MNNIRIILFSLIFFGIQYLNSFSYSAEFKSDNLEIKFDTQNAKILHWKVLNESLSSPHELIKDGNSYFGLEGIIEGETLDYWAQIGGGWDITKNLDEMIFHLKS